MIKFFQKEYSDQEIAKKRESRIYQALVHILKIRLGFDYNRDLFTHRQAVKAHLDNARNDSLKKKKSNGPRGVIECYISSVNKNRDKIKNEITKFFQENYRFEGEVDDNILDDGLTILRYFMEDGISDGEYTKRIYSLVSYDRDKNFGR